MSKSAFSGLHPCGCSDLNWEEPNFPFIKPPKPTKPPEPVVPPTNPDEPTEPGEPTNPTDPPTQPGDEVTVIVCPGEICEVGYVDIPEGATDPLVVTMNFTEINELSFPDLDMKAPNGETFGYTRTFCDSMSACQDNNTNSCSLASYNGYYSEPEIMSFNDPIAGKWIINAQSYQGDKPAEVLFSCNYPIVVTYVEHSCETPSDPIPGDIIPIPNPDIDDPTNISLILYLDATGSMAPLYGTGVNLTEALIKFMRSVEYYCTRNNVNALTSVVFFGDRDYFADNYYNIVSEKQPADYSAEQIRDGSVVYHGYNEPEETGYHAMLDTLEWLQEPGYSTRILLISDFQDKNLELTNDIKGKLSSGYKAYGICPQANNELLQVVGQTPNWDILEDSNWLETLLSQ